MSTSTPTIPPSGRTSLNIVASIIGISVVASLFLVWLVFKHTPVDATGTRFTFLPALNAILNTLSAIALVIGYRFIRRGQVPQHRNAMFTAFFFSSLFLASYIANHYFHGDVHFLGTGVAKFIYLWILLTPHILASVLALPVILITFFLSLSGRFNLHRQLARYTYPLWLYVSVSGVVVYLMLAAYR